MNAELRACQLVATALRLQRAVTLDDDMTSLAEWDSLSHMAIVLELETEAGRRLSPEEIVLVTSVRAIAELLESLSG
jgi:acyl carrier protein